MGGGSSPTRSSYPEISSSPRTPSPGTSSNPSVSVSIDTPFASNNSSHVNESPARRFSIASSAASTSSRESFPDYEATVESLAPGPRPTDSNVILDPWDVRLPFPKDHTGRYITSTENRRPIRSHRNANIWLGPFASNRNLDPRMIAALRREYAAGRVADEVHTAGQDGRDENALYSTGTMQDPPPYGDADDMDGSGSNSGPTASSRIEHVWQSRQHRRRTHAVDDFLVVNEAQLPRAYLARMAGNAGNHPAPNLHSRRSNSQRAPGRTQQHQVPFSDSIVTAPRRSSDTEHGRRSS